MSQSDTMAEPRRKAERARWSGDAIHAIVKLVLRLSLGAGAFGVWLGGFLAGAGDAYTKADLDSFRFRCFARAGRETLGPAQVAGDLGAIARKEWVSHPYVSTEEAFAEMVKEVRSGPHPMPGAQAVLRAVMEVLAECGEQPSLRLFQGILEADGLVALVDMTSDLGRARSYYEDLGPEGQRDCYNELTRLLRENVSCRAELVGIVEGTPPLGMMIADPLSKRLISLDPEAAALFARSMSESRFCGVGWVPRVLDSLPEAPHSVAGSFPPRGAFTFCPFGQIEGKKPTDFWFTYPDDEPLANDATCLDRVAILLADGTKVRVMPVAPAVRDLLLKRGLAARRLPDLAWWLALGGGSLRTTIQGGDIMLLPWEEISKPIQDVLPLDPSAHPTKRETMDFEH